MQVVDVRAAGDEGGIVQKPLVQWDVGLDAFDHDFRQGCGHARQGQFAGFGVGDQLGDQRIVMGRNVVAVVHMGLHADPRPPWLVEVADPPRRGHEGVRVLGVYPTLKGMAVEANVLLLVAEGVAMGDAQLLFYDVHAGHHLGGGMLHLYAGVHLYEIKFSVLVQKLHGAGAAVAQGAAGVDADLSQLVPGRGGKTRSRRFLDDLLMAALHGAVPLPQMDDIAFLVRQHLHFDVARMFEKLLHVERVVAKGRGGLGPGHRHGVAQVRLAVHDPHPPAAAAGRGLDDDRVAQGPGLPTDLIDVLSQNAVGTWHARHAQLAHRLPR